MMSRMVSASILSLAALSACSRAPASEAPTNEAPALVEAAKAGQGAAPVQAPPPSPEPAAEAVPAMPSVPDLAPDEAVGNAEDDGVRFPDEVTDFMVTRDGCDHFRGEEPYDAERRAYLADNIRHLCAGTDAKLADLRLRYRTDRDVLDALKGYEDRIEAPPED